MMARILIVEDDDDRWRAFIRRLPNDMLHRATTVEGAEQLLRGPRYDVAFLDHDLCDYGPRDCYGYREEYTGQHVALALAKLPPERQPGEIVIHSWNPEGAKRMKAILDDAGIACTLAPFEFAAGELEAK